jgi:hypothetical protein
VTLKVGERELSQAFRVVSPASITSTQEDLEAQEDLLLRIHREVDRLATTLNRMRDLRDQLAGIAKRARAREGGEEVATAAEALREQVLEVEQALQVPDLRAGWGDAINEGARLWEKMTGLPGAVALGDYRPTDAAEAVFADMKERIDPQVAAFDALVADAVPPLNKQMIDADLGPILPLP